MGVDVSVPVTQRSNLNKGDQMKRAISVLALMLLLGAVASLAAPGEATSETSLLQPLPDLSEPIMSPASEASACPTVPDTTSFEPEANTAFKGIIQGPCGSCSQVGCRGVQTLTACGSGGFCVTTGNTCSVGFRCYCLQPIGD